jgi:hypothetical protein
MPAFGHALTAAEIDRLVAYMRGFCRDHRWPRGEFNLARALFTEKAFPEDEVVLTSEVALRGPLAIDSEFVYERRVGPLDQLELVFPFSVHDQPGSGTLVGAGDLGLGWKRVLLHSLCSGSILSVLGEVFLPTGIAREGFGAGSVAFEPSLAFGQFWPLVGSSVFGFLQAQAGVELPVRTDYAERSFYARGLLGMSVSQSGWGRMWSPMLEFSFSRGFEAAATAEWDYIPQLQVTLNRRRHVRVSGGMRRPLTGLSERPTAAVAYVLWDWYDGGLFEGW